MEPNSKTPGFNEHTQADLSVSSKLVAELADRRVGQLDIKPSAITPRAAGSLIESSHSGLGAGLRGQGVIPSGYSGTFSFFLSDTQGRTMLAVPDVSWFIGTAVSADTKWPNSSFGMGNMPSSVWNDWFATDNIGVVTKLIIRNNSGADQYVIAICRWRIIRNSTSQLGQGQVNSSHLF